MPAEEALPISHIVVMKSIQSGLSKITLVGTGMYGVPGVMAKIAECLYAAGVNVIQTADSHAAIFVLIPSNNVETARKVLHDGFELGLPITSYAQDPCKQDRR